MILKYLIFLSIKCSYSGSIFFSNTSLRTNEDSKTWTIFHKLFWNSQPTIVENNFIQRIKSKKTSGPSNCNSVFDCLWKESVPILRNGKKFMHCYLHVEISTNSDLHGSVFPPLNKFSLKFSIFLTWKYLRFLLVCFV